MEDLRPNDEVAPPSSVNHPIHLEFAIQLPPTPMDFLGPYPLSSVNLGTQVQL